MIVSSDKAFTPAAAAKTNKAVILIQSGIHSGEIEGKDTALMLVRDMVITKRPHQAAWLKSAIFIVIPVFNVDGHEIAEPLQPRQPERPRDHRNPRPGAGAQSQSRLRQGGDAGDAGWLKLYHAWMPDFMFDNHVTDGADYQYDVTWDMAHHGDMGEPTRDWVNDRFIPELNKRMEAAGHLVSPYGALRGAGQGGGSAAVRKVLERVAGGQGAAADDAAARVAQAGGQTNGSASSSSRSSLPATRICTPLLLNRPCLLVETHSLKDPKDSRLVKLRHHGALHRHRYGRPAEAAHAQFAPRTRSTQRWPATATLRPSTSPARPAQHRTRSCITR